MSNPLAFPMYAINRADTDALWRAVQHLLAERGVPVSEGVPDDSLLAHWQQPGLVLSQTCGYPLMTQLPYVQVVADGRYAILRIRSPVITPCEKKWRHLHPMAIILPGRPLAAAIASR